MDGFEKLSGSKVRHRRLGYVVHVTGRFGVEYVEDGRTATCEVEFGGSPVYVYATALKWQEDDEPAVEPERAEEILDRIVQGFDAMGSSATVVRT